VRFFLLHSLVLCHSLVAVSPAGAAGKAASGPKGASSGQRLAPTRRQPVLRHARLLADTPVQTHRVKQGETLPQTTARSEANNAAWRRYVKAPKEKGALELTTPMARFAGPVVDKDGRLRPDALRALSHLLGAGGKHPPLPERLIRQLVKISDTFGGRPMRVVSGYRTTSYYGDSRHRLSAAVDFSMAEVPNAVLCEYLRDLDGVGVGYYPNSGFVHLDVRTLSAFWVDYAGPGEPPRSTPRPAKPTRGSNRWLLAEIESMVEQSKKAIDPARTASPGVPAATLPTLKPPPVDLPPPSGPGETIASR